MTETGFEIILRNQITHQVNLDPLHQTPPFVAFLPAISVDLARREETGEETATAVTMTNDLLQARLDRCTYGIKHHMQTL